MRKSLIFALLTLFTLSMVMVSCDNNNNDPNPPENGVNYIICSCLNRYIITSHSKPKQDKDLLSLKKKQPEYKVYASGGSLDVGFLLTLMNQGDSTVTDRPSAHDVDVLTLEEQLGNYPFVTYKESWKYESYYFWRCECGRYHQINLYNGTHTEIPSGQQPDEWNQFNYLWE